MANEDGPKIGDGAVIGGVFGEQEEQATQEITKLYAFVAVVRGQTREMVVAMPSQNGIMPLITAYEDQLVEMEKAAQDFADESKTDVKLIKFEKLETVKTVSCHLVEPGPQIIH